VERRGQALRGILQLSPAQPLDPFALAQKMGVELLSPFEIPKLPKVILEHLLNDGSDGWSAGCLRASVSTIVIVYNPNHAVTRRRATLMEELAHVHLRHKGSELVSGGNGTGFRSYKKSEEKEAYWVGAAALLPRSALLNARHQGLGEMTIATQFGVSHALVRFRENVTRVRLY
jgi:Zn-dependent peptidase ImmA (M78 family)